MDEPSGTMTWLIWCDARDSTAWNFGTPNEYLPWCFTVCDEDGYVLLGPDICKEVEAIVRQGKVAQVEVTFSRVRSREGTAPGQS